LVQRWYRPQLLDGARIQEPRFRRREEVPHYRIDVVLIAGNFFNIFNHTNFENPDGNLADSAFGRSRAAFANRVTQLALRFDF